MKKLNARQLAILMGHGFVGWSLCAATMGIGMALGPLQTVLIIHAIAAPVIFALISYVYFTRFGFTSPLETAVAFVAFVVFMDVFVVALLVLRSFGMFASFFGTWLPFTLIFLSTFLAGVLLSSRVRGKGRG